MSSQSDQHFSNDQLGHLVSQIKDYQLTHGCLLKLVGYEQPSTVPSRNVSLSVTPAPFPSQLFTRAQDLQKPYNTLYMRAASDEAWLHGVLAPLIQTNAFARALWAIHEQVKTHRPHGTDDVVCGIFRSDYMLHCAGLASPLLKQVEMNTVCVAGGCHAERAAHLHAHLQRTEDARLFGGPESDRAGRKGPAEATLPTSRNTDALTQALKKAHGLYVPRTARRACVLMVVQGRNFNVADERPIEYGLWDEGVACFRCEWRDVLALTRLDADQTLVFRRFGVEAEVGVVYYRAGYEAEEYDDPGVRTRSRLETSNAVKCPDVLTHLTTFKIVQQALTAPGAVERFLPLDAAARVRETFMHMQPLDDTPAGREAQKLATDPATARHYVLKPNLEGGGHNIYREDMCSFLAKLPATKRSDHVLMRAIEPPAQDGLLMLTDDVYRGPVISELGVIGTCIWKRTNSEHGEGSVDVVSNETAGWTFKTKPVGVNEMNVVKGNGCFDCPDLTGDVSLDTVERG